MEKRVRKKYVKVRMEDALYAALKIHAREGKRPLTRQVEFYIEEGIKREIKDMKLGDRIMPGQHREVSEEQHRLTK